MDDPRVLRIITVGLILAALAVVYFLFVGTFSPKNKVAQNNQSIQSPSPTPTPVATPSTPRVVNPTPVPTTPAVKSPNSLTNTSTKGGVTTLPSTGFPAGLAVIFSVSAVVTGFSLRKFPK